MLCSGGRLEESKCLAVEGFGLCWFAKIVQCGGEVIQAVSLFLLCSWDCLIERDCLAIQGFGLRVFA